MTRRLLEEAIDSSHPWGLGQVRAPAVIGVEVVLEKSESRKTSALLLLAKSSLILLQHLSV